MFPAQAKELHRAADAEYAAKAAPINAQLEPLIAVTRPLEKELHVLQAARDSDMRRTTRIQHDMVAKARMPVQTATQKKSKLAGRWPALRNELRMSLRALAAAPADPDSHPFDAIPDEVAEHILMQLPVWFVIRHVAKTCKRWRRISIIGLKKHHAPAIGIRELFHEYRELPWRHRQDHTTRKSTPLTGHTLGIAALATTPDGRVISAGDDNIMCVWDGTSSTPQKQIETQERITALAVHQNRLYAGLVGGRIRVLDAESMTEIRIDVGHTATVVTLLMHPEERLYSGANDKTVRVWDVESGACLATIQVNGTPTALSVGSCGGWVWCGCSSTTEAVVALDGLALAKVGPIRYNSLGQHEEDDAGVTAVAVGADGTLYTGSGSSFGMAKEESNNWWSTSRGPDPTRTMILAFRVQPASAGEPKSQRMQFGLGRQPRHHSTLPQMVQHMEFRVRPSHVSKVTALAVTPGDLLLSGSSDLTFRVHSCATGAMMWSFEAFPQLPGHDMVLCHDTDFHERWNQGPDTDGDDESFYDTCRESPREDHFVSAICIGRNKIFVAQGNTQKNHDAHFPIWSHQEPEYRHGDVIVFGGAGLPRFS